MKMKITCYWFKASGKYYTTGKGELEKAAWDHYFTVGNTFSRLEALQIALQKAGGGTLPGLSGVSTDLALTLINHDAFPHHFQAGSFDIVARVSE